MKRTMISTVAIMLIAVFSLMGCANEEKALEEAATAAEPAVTAVSDAALPEPEVLIDRFSYAFGHLFTQSYIDQGIDFNADYFAMGMREALEGVEGYYTSEEINAVLMEYQTMIMEEQQAEQDAISAENLEAAETFLESNKTRTGITTTESGLQYEVLVEGDGVMPTADDVVTVHYKGSLLDGSVFESSYDSGSPATFALGGVIPGWVEGLQLMKVGSKYRLYLHPDLAYGPMGSAPVIGPNQLLIFEVELLEIGE